jgi:hypothetical protein
MPCYQAAIALRAKSNLYYFTLKVQVPGNIVRICGKNCRRGIFAADGGNSRIILFRGTLSIPAGTNGTVFLLLLAQSKA